MNVALVLFFAFSAAFATRSFLNVLEENRSRQNLKVVLTGSLEETSKSFPFRYSIVVGTVVMCGVFAAWPPLTWIHIVSFGVGALLPWFHLKEKNSEQRWSYLRHFPEFLDLLALGTSSGLTIERAWSAAVSYMTPSALRQELARASEKFALGRPREETLRTLAATLNDEWLAAVITLIIHGMKRGTPLQELLMSEARSLRQATMSAVEKRAQTASIRILFPILLFIFPTLFLILFGPLAIHYFQTGSLF